MKSIQLLPKGFSVLGQRVGLYKNRSKPDLALFVSRNIAKAVGCLTTNQVKAAPVLLSASVLKTGSARAIVANSGCANACTGKRGFSDAQKMVGITAQALQENPRYILIASTGVIGQFLPLEKIEVGIKSLAQKISSGQSNVSSAVQAIMTTDTRMKVASRKIHLGAKTITLWGCVKGSGMIHPNMATMLSFILTDADAPLPFLRQTLRQSVENSFNAVSVDGDTSTNDSVFLLANGQSGSLSNRKEQEKFSTALQDLCLELAKQMAFDGEGATQRVEITVCGARSKSDAKRVAETVATSPLVKTAFFGRDANWGRILAAVGRSGVRLNPNRIDVSLGSIRVAKNGLAVSFSESKAKSVLSQKCVPLLINLNLGKESFTYFTCDLSIDYVKINADYRS